MPYSWEGINALFHTGKLHHIMQYQFLETQQSFILGASVNVFPEISLLNQLGPWSKQVQICWFTGLLIPF